MTAKSAGVAIRAVEPDPEPISPKPINPEPISCLLRARTQANHVATETRTFMVELLAGRASIGAYRRYLEQYALVYQALESRPANPGDPAFLHDPALWRADAIEADLAALGVADSQSTPPSPATTRYCERLTEVAAGSYPAYLAHHYVRYLGDLSGGQAVAVLLQRNYQLADDQLNWYRFGEIPSLVQYKRGYRTALDGLTLTSDEIETIIKEAILAFDLNAGIFDELAQEFGLPAHQPTPGAVDAVA